jgi:acetoin utilization protein AcuB
MRVEDLMTSKVFTVEQHDLIDRVFFLIHYEFTRRRKRQSYRYRIRP